MKTLLCTLAATTLLAGCAHPYLISTELDPARAAARANRGTGTNISRGTDRAVSTLDRQDIERLLAPGGSTEARKK